MAKKEVKKLPEVTPCGGCYSTTRTINGKCEHCGKKKEEKKEKTKMWKDLTEEEKRQFVYDCHQGMDKNDLINIIIDDLSEEKFDQYGESYNEIHKEEEYPDQDWIKKTRVKEVK